MTHGIILALVLEQGDTVKHAKIVDKAAKLADRSVADYVRDVTLQWAASDAGVPAPDYSVLPRFSDAVTEAARALGLTKEHYLRLAAAEKLERDAAKGRVETVVRRASVAAKRADQVLDKAGSGERRRVS